MRQKSEENCTRDSKFASILTNLGAQNTLLDYFLPCFIASSAARPKIGVIKTRKSESLGPKNSETEIFSPPAKYFNRAYFFRFE